MPIGSRMMEWTRGDYVVTTNPSDQDIEVIHGFLAQSYWAKGIPKETVKKSLNGALCFALLYQGRQIGFARVISDFATIAYLGDVFVLAEHQGQGLSKWLMDCIVAHPELQGMRRWLLATSDAHGLYEKYGFTPLKQPSAFMERHNASVYLKAVNAPASI